MQKRTIRATLTKTIPDDFARGKETVLFATGDDGTLYRFIDNTMTRMYWYKAVGARLDFIVDEDRHFGRYLGCEEYELTADDVVAAPDA